MDKAPETSDPPTNPKKRTYADAFGEREYDVERYGQEIDDDFFERNVGHGIYNKN